MYALLRLLFCGCFFVVLSSLGNLLVALVAKNSARFELDSTEEIAISILCGSALLRVIMLALGFASLYQWTVLVPLTTLALWFGSPRLLALSKRAGRSARDALHKRNSDALGLAVAGTAVLIACVAVASFKFLLPNGTGDYFTHYLPYYQTVVARGNIWPNDVWYHFYISKGAGDIFLAMILSDPLGPLTVSCVMFLCALLIIFAMVSRGTGDALAGLAAAAVTGAGLIWTVELRMFFVDWAEFSKEHVITAVLFLGCVWAVWRQKTIPSEARRAWALLTSAIFVGLILLRVQFAAIALVFLSIVAGWEFLAGKRHDASSRALPIAATFVAALIVLSLNFAITGLAEVTPFRVFWRFADQARFAHWVSPFLMLLLELGSSPSLGAIGPPNFSHYHPLALIATVFRLHRVSPYLWPLGIPLGGALLFSLVVLWRRRAARQYVLAGYLGACVAMLLSAFLLFFAVNQTVSVYRLYVFTIFPVIAVGTLPFAIARAFANRKSGAAIGLIVACLCLIGVVSQLHRVPRAERSLAWRFLTARASIADAYSAQNAVWPAALKMSAVAGPGAAIWLSEVGAHFCVAPTCNTESFFSYSMGKYWHAIMFGSPEEAKRALQEGGLNYFAIDTGSPFFDLLPYSRLFRPDAIGKYLGIVWTDGTVYLLTWRSSRTLPLSEAFMAGYANAIKAGLRIADFAALYSDLDGIYVKWSTNRRWPVKTDPDEPRPRGWQ